MARGVLLLKPLSLGKWPALFVPRFKGSGHPLFLQALDALREEVESRRPSGRQTTAGRVRFCQSLSL